MSKISRDSCGWNLRLGGSLLAIALPIAFLAKSTLAQITPDETLGAERSVITPNINIKGLSADRIDGGAIRGANLFHSFEQFNVGEGQRVYFANPAGIENILSRVTGTDASDILGTLGVKGGANLFLLNPNGIIFGQNAQLDIRGSFVASTANALVFGNGYRFSATSPNAPPLLTVNVPIGLQYGVQEPATITNSGNLQVGGDLTLLAGAISSTGKLAAPAGEVQLAGVNGDVQVQDVSALSAILFASNNLILEESQVRTAEDLTLFAGNTVRVRDSVENPFVAHAGGNLYIQGNQGIDILALNHAETPFQSGGNLSLVSDGIISGDAHFASGGTFSILNLGGEPGNFVSLYDPIISSEKDVVLGDYTGVSLKVESMGSIRAGNIRITGPDTTLTSGSDPDISILRRSPALILRAGVDKLENPPSSLIPVYNNNFEGEVPSEELSNTSTDVTPKGNRRFLGQFDNETVNLALDNLPPHTTATVSFDLFIISSWDGNDTTYGPDIWNLSIDRGKTLLNTTFSNHDFTLGSQPGYPQFQSYPANYDSKNIVNNPARQGAIETPNSLGYEFKFGSIDQTKPVDSVYSFSFTFNHSDSSLKLNFSANGSGEGFGIHDESWGLDNVKVSIEPTVTSPGVASPGNIKVGNLFTPGGPVILSAPGNIQTGSITTQGGDISLDSGGSINTTAGMIDSSSNQNGGVITLRADGDIQTGSIITKGGDISGDISLDSGGTINTTAGKLDSYSNHNGGAISLTANGDIKLGEITSSGKVFSGQIELNSRTGGIFANGIIMIRSDTFGTRRGGDINITARSLSLTNGARVLTGTFNDGAAGNLTVNVSESVEVVGTGTSSGSTVFSLLSTATGGSKPAGELTINTRHLIVKDGGAIATSTAGTGQGGNLTVTATESIQLSGTAPNGFPSGLSTDTLRDGNAGDLTINTRHLIIENGAAASVSTFGRGKGGNLIVNNSESIEPELIELRGTSRRGFASGLYAQTFGEGDAGDLRINNTQDLIIRDGAKITVTAINTKEDKFPIEVLYDNIPDPIPDPIPDTNLRQILKNTQATGDAGNIEVTADFISLDNQGQIIAETEATEGGNITLNARDLLLLRHNSSISTTAGTDENREAGGNGGNITINTPFVVGIPRENSDITANAFLGNGGSVTITAQGIYGLKFRPDLTPRSDITASSEFGNPGVVTLNLPDIDPNRGLVNIPQPQDPDLIEQGCPADDNRFTVTGRGGLPPQPDEALRAEAIIPPTNANQTTLENPLIPSKPTQIIEAQGWVINAQGQVMLVAYNPNVTSSNPWSNRQECHAP